MPVYVCAESALQHYRSALRPAKETSAVWIENLDNADSLKKDVALLDLTGLGLPSPSPEEPLHVLVPPSTARGRSKSVLPTVWSGMLPRGAFRMIQRDAFVSSPEFLFLQMARKLDLVALVELGMELCGSYRRMAANNQTAYDQPILTTPQKIKRFLETVGPARGAARAAQALKYVVPNSASPFETIVCLLLCLPRRYGGYALPTPRLNASIKLGKRGREHTLRRSSVPDLYWLEPRLDVECHGKKHNLEKTRYEDSMRRKALERMGVEVVELTYEEVKDKKLFHATVRRLAKKLGLRLRAQSERGFAKHQQELRDRLFPPDVSEEQLWNSNIPPSEAPDEFTDWSGEELPPEFDSWDVYMADGETPEL